MRATKRKPHVAILVEKVLTLIDALSKLENSESTQLRVVHESSSLAA
jgi:hypothetical protein